MKRILIAVGIVVAILLLAAVALPFFVNANQFRPLLESKLANALGRQVKLGEVARVLDTTGPNTVNRERVQRRIVVSCNVEKRDVAGVVADIRRALRPVEESLRGQGGSYRIEYGGQYEEQQKSFRDLVFVLILAVLLVSGLLLVV